MNRLTLLVPVSMSSASEPLTRLSTGVASGELCVTVWLFFVQSPFLFARLGSTKFLAIMIPLTHLYFSTITVANFFIAAISIIRAGGFRLEVVIQSMQCLAAIATLGVTLVRGMGGDVLSFGVMLGSIEIHMRRE